MSDYDKDKVSPRNWTQSVAPGLIYDSNEAVICHSDYGETEVGDLTGFILKGDEDHVLHCINSHDPLAKALEYCLKIPGHSYSTSCFCANCEHTREALAAAKGDAPPK